MAMMALVLLVEAAFALLVAAAGAVMFALSLNASPPPAVMGSALQGLALAISLVPLVLLVWVVYRRFFKPLTWPRVPLGIWLPFVTSPGCLFLSWGTFFLAAVLIQP